MNNEIKTKALAKKLLAREFGEFFIYPMHDQTIDLVWSSLSTHQLLDTVVDDDTIEMEARFLACEVLFKKDVMFLSRHEPEKIAEIYANSLSNNFTGMANSW